MGTLANIIHAAATVIPAVPPSNPAQLLTGPQLLQVFASVEQAVSALETYSRGAKIWYGPGPAEEADARGAGNLDLYLFSTNGDLWQKNGDGDWVFLLSLKGGPGLPGPRGATGATGGPGASGASGRNGTDGTNGRNGTDGRDGNRLLLFNVAPAGSDGNVGDVAIVSSSGDLQEKTGSGWVVRGNLKGPKGDPGGTTGTGAGGTSYTLPQATTAALGGIKSAGTGLDGNVVVNADGSATAPTGMGGTGASSFVQTAAPTPADGASGDNWVYVNQTNQTARFYKKVGAVWQTQGAAIGGPPDVLNAAAAPYLVSAANTAAANTAAINQAIADGLAQSKRVKLPGGVLNVNNIQYDNRVWLEGARRVSTTLRANASGATIKSTGIDLLYPAGGITGIRFEGQGIGTNAIHLVACAYYTISDVYVKGYTSFAGNVDSCIFGRWDECFFRGTWGGLRLHSTTLINNQDEVGGPQSAFPMPNNLTHIHKCKFNDMPGLGVDCTYASGVLIDGQSDFERCGTTGNQDTGCIRWAGGFAESGIGLRVADCWVESQRGGPVINILPGSSHTRHSVSNTTIRRRTDIPAELGGTAVCAVRVTADGNLRNEVKIENCVLEGHAKDVELIGAKAFAYIDCSTVGSYSTPTAAQYQVLSYGASVGGTSLVTAGTEQIIGQTGDVYGASYLSMMGRKGTLGAMLYSTLPLVDLAFRAITTNPNRTDQYNIRYEARSGVEDRIHYANVDGELQITNPYPNGRNAVDVPPKYLAVFGSNVTLFLTEKVAINTRTATEALQIGGRIAIENNTIPNDGQAGGGVLFVHQGALKFKGENGTLTVIAPA